MELLNGGTRFGRTRRRHGRGNGLLAAVAVTIALCINLPLVYIVVRATQNGRDAFLRTMISRSSAELLVQTVGLILGVTIFTLVIAVPLAWLVVRTDLRARRIWAVLGALPLVFPSYVSAFALIATLGPRGYVQGWLEPFGVERMPGIVIGYPGALLSLALFTYPYTYLLLVAALRGLDPALEESSRGLGRGRWRTFRSIVLPQLRAPIYSGSLLVVLYTISDFGAVSIVRYDTLTFSIYNAYRTLFDRSVAASMATVLVLLALVFIAGQAFVQRRLRPTRSRPARPAPRLALGRWQWPCQLMLGGLSLLTLVTPVAVITFWGLRAIARGNPLGSAGWATLNSLGVSLIAALAALVLAVPVAAWSVRYPGRVSRITERLTYSGHALPGLVIALSLVFFSTRHLPALYQSVPLLIGAYVVRFLPQSLSATRSSMAEVSPVFEEAGRGLGRSFAGVVGTVTLPLIRRGLFAGAGLVFLTCMKELPATLILRPIGFETLATRIWSAASDRVFSEAALPALILLLASALPVYLLTIRPALSERTR